MKINHKMLLAGAMAAIMSMSVFGCDGKNKETVDNTENGSSLDYLGEYSEEDGEDYLTASVGVYDKDNEPEYALEMLDWLKRVSLYPEIMQSVVIDEDSVKYTIVNKDKNNPVSYSEFEFIFTYNGDKYLFKYRWEDLNYDTLFSGVETANAGTYPSATYRFGSYTTTLSAADGATTEENVVNLATAMFNSIRNKMNNLFIQFENEEGLPTFPEGAVIDKDFLSCWESDEIRRYELYFTYNGYRYEIRFTKYFSEQTEINLGTGNNYRFANWHIGQWEIDLYSTSSSVTEEEITALATSLYNSMSAD